MKSYKAAVMGAALAATLAVPARAGDWANIRPAHNIDGQHATVRVEGGADLGKHGKFYGFLDLDGSTEHPLDLEQFYGEARGMLNLGNSRWAAATELDIGSGMGDFLRVGATYTPDTGKKNFTQLRLWPWETSGTHGPQVSVFSEQQLSDRVSVSGLMDYNTDPNTAYLEAEVDVKLGKRTMVIDPKTKKQHAVVGDNPTLFAQARGFGTIDDRIDIAPVVGLKWNF